MLLVCIYLTKSSGTKSVYGKNNKRHCKTTRYCSETNTFDLRTRYIWYTIIYLSRPERRSMKRWGEKWFGNTGSYELGRLESSDGGGHNASIIGKPKEDGYLFVQSLKLWQRLSRNIFLKSYTSWCLTRNFRLTRTTGNTLSAYCSRYNFPCH